MSSRASHCSSPSGRPRRLGLALAIAVLEAPRPRRAQYTEGRVCGCAFGVAAPWCSSAGVLSGVVSCICCHALLQVHLVRISS